MKKLELLIKIISWVTIAALPLLAINNHYMLFIVPIWIRNWLMPILTAAAVGYLTNWIAIWLLFRPYEKKCFFVQGVIPRNKDELGSELGQIIPQYLLKTEDLSDQLGNMVREYLQNPILLEDLRNQVNVFFRKNSAKIAAFLLPYIENAIRRAIRENLTAEKLGILYDKIVVRYLGEEKNRVFLAAGIVAELKENSSGLTQILRDNLRTGVKEYVRNEYPLLVNFFNADEFAAQLVDYLNWRRIQTQLEAKLDEAETHEAISKGLVHLTLKLHDYLNSPEAAVQLESFIAVHRENAAVFLKQYLSEKIPEIVDYWLRQNELWEAVSNLVVPLAQVFVSKKLRQDGNLLISKLDLSGKIESSVKKMNMAELHQMINHASGKHLTIIQLLGYLLGALAGFLLIFT